MFKSVEPISHPSNAIWGPALWMILHSACERINSKNEESRIWIGLLQSLRYSLPCPQCKRHYTAYMKGVPFGLITKENIRRWLYLLHEQVNGRTDKPSFSPNQLEQYEQPFHFTKYYAIVQHHMLMSVRQGVSAHSDVQRTLRFLTEMKCFYDFF